MEVDSGQSAARSSATDTGLLSVSPRRATRTCTSGRPSLCGNISSSSSFSGKSRKRHLKTPSGISRSGSLTDEIVNFDTLGLILKPPPLKSSRQTGFPDSQVVENSPYTWSIRSSSPATVSRRFTSAWLRHLVVGILLCWLATAVVAVGAVAEDAASVDVRSSARAGSRTELPLRWTPYIVARLDNLILWPGLIAWRGTATDVDQVFPPLPGSRSVTKL
ncbi:hypothetical protein RRG08_049075 [Elysia crispata]|uniref:Uncharacterized protein n=1 Tax=Elysia crispata TaxID=231223 RepID=A0AAE1AAG9_9GAST|nr:hypothetical protein RRG08_049075 [Elysia crispata]